MKTLLYLIAGHYFADFNQTDYMVRVKNEGLSMEFLHVMTAHCAIQAGTVLLATGRSDLAIAEFVAHFVTDCLKAGGKIGYTMDQFIHLTCRIVWWVLA